MGLRTAGGEAGGSAEAVLRQALATEPESADVIYTDAQAGLTLTRLEDLQRMGRYKLERHQRVGILDLAGGIGTALMGTLESKASFAVESYRMCEVDPVSRGVLLANEQKYKDRYLDRLGRTDTLTGWAAEPLLTWRRSLNTCSCSPGQRKRSSGT